MPRLIEQGDPGTDRPILLDGVELSVLPADLDSPPEPVSDYLDRLNGRASEHQRRPSFYGAPSHTDRYPFTFAYDQIRGPDRIIMETIRVRGGTHLLTVWRMVPVIWQCQAGISRHYLPRRPAAHLYDGLLIGGDAGATVVNTEHFPIDATLNGAALAVTYAEGPTLADPGEGGVVVAREADVSGEAAGYVGIRVGGTLQTGDELMLWGCWTHEVSLRAPGLVMRGQSESHAYVFVEV